MHLKECSKYFFSFPETTKFVHVASFKLTFLKKVLFYPGGGWLQKFLRKKKKKKDFNC